MYGNSDRFTIKFHDKAKCLFPLKKIHFQNIFSLLELFNNPRTHIIGTTHPKI